MPQIMGILNVTPDSFSDGGRFTHIDQAVEQALRMQAEGAAIIDVGGESTRPGAGPVSVDEELGRVIPLIDALAGELSVPISIDTSKPGVMREAVRAGAGMINDVYALRQPGAASMVAELDVPVCLMHMQGEPRSMQENPQYGDIVADISEFFRQRIDSCVAAGVRAENILLDPGFGFGKTLEHNLVLVKKLQQFQVLGHPLLVGMSRKSMIGAVLERDVDGRLFGGIALATLAAWLGAAVIRVHDVSATMDAVRMVRAVLSSN